MRVRSGSMSDDSSGSRFDGPAGPAGSGRSGRAGGPERSWRVSGGTTALKLAAAAAFALVALLSLDNPVRLAFAALAAAVLAGYAVRDLVAPVRVRADPSGVTVVAGFAGRRRLAWAQIERVRVDEHRRLGLRSELLEIDAGDALYLFSPYDLGAPCGEVAQTLIGLRTGAGGRAPAGQDRAATHVADRGDAAGGPAGAR
jgi:hypothetical protein